MKADELLHQFLDQFNNVIAPGAEALSTELQQKMRTAAQSAFEKLDLVTRDEFDAQQAVLIRTREKLETLEIQLAEMESRLKDQ